MAEELDTSWFDLKNYEVLKTMSIEGWVSLLDIRADCIEPYDCCDVTEEDREYTRQEIVNDLKAGCFESEKFVEMFANLDLEDYAQEVLMWHSFSTSTVDSLRNYQAWYNSNESRPGSEWVAFQKMRDEWLKPWENDEDDDIKASTSKLKYIR